MHIFFSEARKDTFSEGENETMRDAQREGKRDRERESANKNGYQRNVQSSNGVFFEVLVIGNRIPDVK